MKGKDAALAAIAQLDRQILASGPGLEHAAAKLGTRRETLETVLLHAPTLDDLEGLRSRTKILEERLLHWRRLANMELSLIDQHLRYVSCQERGGDGVSSILDVEA